MELSTILGLILGIVFVFLGLLTGGANLAQFIEPPWVLIVLGGTGAATMVAYPMAVLRQIPGLFALAFRRQRLDSKNAAETIYQLAETVRRDGILAMEDEARQSGDPFLRKCVGLITEGADSKLVREIMENQLDDLACDRATGAAVMDSMATFSTAFGVIGALICLGEIFMDSNLISMDIFISAAVAVLCIIHGCLMANLLLIPIGKKLRCIGDLEQRHKALILEGVLAIQNGDSPQTIRQRMGILSADESL